MSIIYSALQKTQQKRESDRVSFTENKTSTNRFLFFLKIAFFIVISAVIIIAGYEDIKIWRTHHKPIPIAKKPFAPSTAPLPNLTLNGVFLSNNEKIASINHRFFHLGDVVEDLKITDINLGRVELKNANRFIVLQVAES